MTERDASRTALGVAAIRAIHQLLDGEPKILHDPIAARLLDPDVLGAISTGAARTEDPAVRALRSRVVLRSRYAEDRLALAAGRGVRQLVVLGAGLDTFAYRQPCWARQLSIFEVDHPASQADKRARLRRAGVPTPPNLQFAPIDFETISLGGGLRASTLDFRTPTFFSCLGVLVYLTREAVDAVFDLVAGFPSGSEHASVGHPRQDHNPDKPAYIMAGSGETVTYRELDARSNQGAHLFRSLGIQAGDSVAFFMDNTPLL
jgi:methyltransferase (TIGR00027 family)